MPQRAAVAITSTARICRIRIRSRRTWKRCTRPYSAKRSPCTAEAGGCIWFRLPFARRARFTSVAPCRVREAPWATPGRWPAATSTEVPKWARKALGMTTCIAGVGIRARLARWLQTQACARRAKVARVTGFAGCGIESILVCASLAQSATLHRLERLE